MQARLLLAAAIALVAFPTLGSAVPARPKYIECVDGSECGTMECCVIGGGRFSLPRCMLFGDIGDSCRPGEGRPNMLINTTVEYPDRQPVQLVAVHLHLCPCGAGLRCDQGRCAAPEQHDLNTVW